MSTCSTCGAWNPDGARFCHACGSALTDGSEFGREVRKVVTVMFTDVAGSTSLGERLDPETLRRVMERWFAAVKGVIEHHGGTVEKFIGDAVMAVFGVPVAHEDDSLRAVRAASELEGTLVALNDELERLWGVRLAIRTGVNTGGVVAGDPSSGQSFVSGDAVNVAARLEQLAEPGQILIGETTWRLVRDAVRVAPAGPLPLRGKEHPVPAYLLLEVVAGAARLTRRLDSPMVGRDDELRTLSEAFDRVVRGRICELVTVVGEAGVGKSRLSAELLVRVGSAARVLQGRCLPYGNGITFWPIGEMVRSAAAIEELDSPAEAISKIGGLLGGRPVDASMIRDRIGAAIGLGERSGDIQDTFWAIRRLLETLAVDGPVVAVFDDIHWAEPTLLDLIEYLAGFSRGSGILILCLARPELRDLRPEWGRTGSIVTLTPLDRATTEDLIGNLTGRTRLPGDISRRIVDAAEGNPLFVEELFGMLIDDGSLRKDDGSWTATRDPSSLAAPGTIQALITARLDRLGDEERGVIQRASVVGKFFWWGAVADLSPVDDRAAVGAGLQALVRRELIRPDESTLAGEDAYSFCHLLIRDAAYASIPKATRADLHERFAAWLEARAGDRIAEFEEIVGYHLEEAHHLRVELSRGDARAGVLGDRGAAHLAIAGRRAMSRGDSSGAAALFERAAAIMPEDAPGRPEILVHLGGLLRETGDFARADKVLTLATELAERLGQQSLGAHARAERAYVALDSDPRAWESAADELGAAAETLRQWRDHERLAEVLVRLASAKFFRGQVLEAEQDLREASDAVERIRVPALAVRIDWSLASFADFGPAPISEGLRRVDAALATAGENPRITCELRLLQAIFVAGQGRLDEARVIAGNAEGRLGDLGENAFSIQITTEARWRIAALAGDLEQEEAAVRRCYLELESVGNLSHLASLAWRRADVLSRLGRLGEGEPYADESRRLGNRGDIDVQVGWRMAMGRILRMRERYADANRVLAEGLDIARRTDYVGHTADVLMELAHVQRAVGDRSGARRHCQEALELYERKENAVLAGRADAFLRELGPAQ